MSTERSDKLYHSYVEAAQKFDYFLVSVDLALVGYLGSQHSPISFGLNSSTFEIAALVFLLISAFAGLRRIETSVILLGMSQMRLNNEENAGEFTAAAISGGRALNESTGEIMSSNYLLNKAQEHMIGAQLAGEEVDKMTDRVGLWYRARDRFLIIGLVLLVFARFLNL